MPADEVLFNLWFNFLFELILKILMVLYTSCRRNTFKFILLYPSNKFNLIFPVCILFHFISYYVTSSLAFTFLFSEFIHQLSEISVHLIQAYSFNVESDYTALYVNEFYYFSFASLYVRLVTPVGVHILCATAWYEGIKRKSCVIIQELIP
jgi:hypothetical protein